MHTMARAITTASRKHPSTRRWPHPGILLEAAVMLTAAAEAMSFLDHLEELRKRILWSVVSIAAAGAVCWMFAGTLYDIASAPIRSHPAVTLSLSRPQDIFALQMKITLVAASFLAAPLILTQVWLFIAPGLHRHERRYAVPFVLFSSLLFVAGGAFGYFVAFPLALGFLLDWIVAAKLTPIIDAIEYFDLFFSIIVALGIVFQIPAVVFVLSRVGLVTAGMLARHVKHALLGCVVVAAVITPTTDFGNMLAIAGPMIVLYVAGIGIAWLFGKPRSAG